MSSHDLRLRQALAVVAASLLAALASGCVHHHYHGGAYVRRAGPPPWAPANGYRQRYDGVMLVFDGGLGAYVIEGRPYHYYFQGHYFRLLGARWEIATRVSGPWSWVESDDLPAGLRRQHAEFEVRDAAHERRDQHLDAVRDRRDAQREAVQDRRDDRREAVQDRHDAHREVVRERHEAQHEVVQQKREVAKERREVAHERRDARQQERAARHGAAREPEAQVPANAQDW